MPSSLAALCVPSGSRDFIIRACLPRLEGVDAREVAAHGMAGGPGSCPVDHACLPCGTPGVSSSHNLTLPEG